MGIARLKRGSYAATSQRDNPVVSGTTGTVSTSSYSIGSANYSIYKFTTGAGSITFSKGGTIDLLVVGGGGASGNYGTSGGGGGGYVQEFLNQRVEAATYTTAVGAGGATTGGNGGDGGESSFTGTNVNVRSGIATGGGSYNTVVARGMISGAPGHADTLGYKGAFGSAFGGAPVPNSGTGGGGSGGNGLTSPTRAGGIGVYSSIETGSAIGYGGGGAGGANDTTQYGVTTWGAGRSGHNSLNPENGAANRGGGGGGPGWSTPNPGTYGQGGSGVVIVRVRTN
jgi:hypothetical protein